MVLPEVTTLAEARDAIRDLAEEVEKLRTDWNGRYQLKRGKGYEYISPQLFQYGV